MDERQRVAETALKRAIGRRIRQARMMRGLSRATLAEKLGVSYQQVQKYESGRDGISVTRLLVLLEVLGIKVGWLVGE